MAETERIKWNGDRWGVLIDPLWLKEMELKVVELMSLTCQEECHVDGGQYGVDENVFSKVQNSTGYALTSQRRQQDGKFELSLFKQNQLISDMMMNPLLPNNNNQQVYMFFTAIPQQTNHHHQPMNPAPQPSPPSQSLSSLISPNTIQVMGQKRTILQIKRHSPSQQLQNKTNNTNIKTNNNNKNNINSLQSMMQSMMMMGDQNQQLQQQQQQQCYGNNGLVCSQESTNCSPVGFSLSEKKNKINKKNMNNMNNMDYKINKKKQVNNMNNKSNNIFGNTFNTAGNNNNQMGQIQINCQQQLTMFYSEFNHYNNQNQIVNQNVNIINPIDIDIHLDRKEQQLYNHHDSNMHTQIQNNTTTQQQQRQSFKRDSSGMNLPKSSNNNFNDDRRQQLVRLAAEEKEKIVKKKIQKRKKETRKLLLNEDSDQDQEGQEEEDGQGEDNRLNRKVQSLRDKDTKNSNNGMGFGFVNRGGNNNNGNNNINNINISSNINTNTHNIASNPFIVNTTTLPQSLLTNINNIQTIQQTQQLPVTRSIRLQSNKQLDKLINNYNEVCVGDDIDVNKKKRVKNNQCAVVKGNDNNNTNQYVQQQHIRHVQQQQEQQQQEQQQQPYISYHQPAIITPPPLLISNNQQLQQTPNSYQHNQHHNQQHYQHHQHYSTHLHHSAHLHHIYFKNNNNNNDSNSNSNNNNSNKLIDELIKSDRIFTNDKLTVQQMMLADLLYYHPTYQMVHGNYLNVDVNSNLIDNHHHVQLHQQQHHQQQTHHFHQQQTITLTNNNTNSQLMRQLMSQFSQLLTYQTNTIDEFNQFISQKLFVYQKDNQCQKEKDKDKDKDKDKEGIFNSNQKQLSTISSELTLQQFIYILKHTQKQLITQLLKQTNKLFCINRQEQQQQQQQQHHRQHHHHQQSLSLYKQVQNICNSDGKLRELMCLLQQTIIGELYCNINKVIIMTSDNSNNNNYMIDNTKDSGQIKLVKQQQQLTGRQLQLYRLIKGYVSSNNINNINISNTHNNNISSHNNNIVSHAHYKHNQQIFNTMLNQFIALQQMDCSFTISCEDKHQNQNKDRNNDNNEKDKNKDNKNNPSSPSSQRSNQLQQPVVTTINTTLQQQQQQYAIKHKLISYIQKTQNKVRQMQQIINTIMYDVFGQSNCQKSSNNQYQGVHQMVDCRTGQIINHYPHYDMQNNHYNEFIATLISPSNQHKVGSYKTTTSSYSSLSSYLQSDSGSMLTQQLQQASNLIQSVQRFIIMRRSLESENRQNNSVDSEQFSNNNNNNCDNLQQLTINNIFININHHNNNNNNISDINNNNNNLMIDQQQVQLIQNTITSIITMLDHILIDVELMTVMESSSQQ